MSFRLNWGRKKKGKSLAWSRRLGAAKTKADNQRHIKWLTYVREFSQYTTPCMALAPRRNHDREDLIVLLTPVLCKVIIFSFIRSEIASFPQLRQETNQATFQTYSEGLDVLAVVEGEDGAPRGHKSLVWRFLGVLCEGEGGTAVFPLFSPPLPLL